MNASSSQVTQGAVPFLNDSDTGRKLQTHRTEKWNPSELLRGSVGSFSDRHF